MPVRRLLLCLVLAALLAVTLAACGASSAGATHPSGIDGIVLEEGGEAIVSPSPLPGGFGSGLQGRPDPFPMVEVEVASGAQAGKDVARVRPNAAALFSVNLPPGSYVLWPLLPTNGGRAHFTTVTVRAGQRTRALVLLDVM